MLLVVFELVRSRRLLERYALLWLFSTTILLVLAIWRGVLEEISNSIGVAYPPNALFLVAFAFVLLLLLHFSTIVSRLTDQSKALAQRIALLEQEVRQSEQTHNPAAESQAVTDPDDTATTRSH